MMANMQQILADQGFDGLIQFNASDQYCFTSVWDEKNARFAHCFVPVLSALPALIAAFLLLLQICLFAVNYRPSWSIPFVQEPKQRFAEGDARPRRRPLLAIILALLSTVGFLLQLPEIIRTRGTAASVFPAVSWFIVTGTLAIVRPQTPPFGVLTILVAQGIIDIIRYNDLQQIGSPQTNTNLVAATIAVAIVAICTVLSMPLRDPNQPAIDISAPMSTPTSALRSPEDNITLWQFMSVSWMTPLIRMGYGRQLEDEDVWQLAYEFHHQRLHDSFRLLKGTVIQRLVRANIIDLIILTFLGVLELVLQYSTPLLLQQLLKSMEDASAPKRAALTYAALGFAVRVIAAQSGIFSLWYGRRCYERSRGEMITMLYEKTLDRKIGFVSETGAAEPFSNGNANGHANGHAMNGDASRTKEKTSWQRLQSQVHGIFKRQKAAPTPKEPASMGKILNLMRNDVYEVAQRFWEFQGLIQKPLSVIFSFTLVIKLLGWPSMLAVFAMALAQILNFVFAKVMIRYEKRRRLATDSKLQVTTQWIEAIRHLRWYGWQDAWLSQIMSARQKELNLRIITSIWNVVIGFCNTLALDLAPVIGFFAYTVIGGKPLRVDIAFPAWQLFQMMTMSLRDLPNLIIVLINAWVAVGRIEDYMAEPDKEEQESELELEGGLALKKGHFAWPGSGKEVLDVDIAFPKALTVVCGEVASGKTALLQAILGELDILGGWILRPREPIAYCAQTPWLQSMSIRENILFGQHYEEARYMEVLRCCALLPDLKEFKAGDLSLIGENGIGLSGGQRARVALARAAYSRAKNVLLDDPLASLDQETAEHIVHHCFRDGSIFGGRTVILVTHRTDIVCQVAKQVIKMSDGHAMVLGEAALSDDVAASLAKFKYQKKSNEEELAKHDPDAVPDKFIEDEHRARGGVKASVYWEYIKAGKIIYWCILIPILAIYRIFSIASSWWLKSWGEAYDRKSTFNILIQASDVVTGKSTFPDNLPAPDDNIKPWLLGFFILALGQSFTYIFSQSMMIVIVYTAGKNMFKAIMGRVAGATFRFYDVTPVGRLMNRMTSDIGVIDGNISQQFQAVAWLSISWISSIVVIASVTPTFLVFAVCLTITFVLIFLRFIPTLQSLRRLEMISLTPLMSNFGTLLDGLVTVRAFRVQRQFQNRVVRVVDTFQKMDHFYWTLQGWLMYRYDILLAISTLLITALALQTNVSAGLTAFVLIAANKVVKSTHGLCKQYGQLQMEFVSVERVVELLSLEQEAKGNLDPPAWWPRVRGDIVFEDVTIRYAPHMKPALEGLSIRIPGGSKAGILGRTGSGKSTIALSLIGTLAPERGRILIDGVDLSAVNKQTLRTKITFLAQDAVLFPGSLRKNLDPLNEYDDDACEAALRQACKNQGFDLETKIEAGGRNLSQGQRQLIGLARAVLRRSEIIILDEATASIDRDTAAQIHQVLRRELKDSTVMMIAHRYEALRDLDYGVVIGKGRLLKQGAVEELFEPEVEESLAKQMGDEDEED